MNDRFPMPTVKEDDLHGSIVKLLETTPYWPEELVHCGWRPEDERRSMAAEYRKALAKAIDFPVSNNFQALGELAYRLGIITLTEEVL